MGPLVLLHDYPALLAIVDPLLATLATTCFYLA